MDEAFQIAGLRGITIMATVGNRGCGYYSIMDEAFQIAGLRGITIMATVGNRGCGSGLCSASQQALHVHWPSSSAFVTAVGATTMPDDWNGFNVRERAPNIPEFCYYPSASGSCYNRTSQHNTAHWFNSGGFSRVNPLPAWQVEAVTSYVNSGIELPEGWALGRAVPDIAMVGSAEYYKEFEESLQQSSFAMRTSPHIATAIAAASVVMINDKRLQHGLPAVGFLNPLLYSLRELG
eukprot:TRINITY_DN4355_c0_g2_i1.p2 TRINITY_DN4355_c0_g2~~TRINITY_DN4355_c0_g2_i1.p2  ORF type:complete len:236 (+),score=51.05 TRINITY_DN4355_c0_g2_i1:1082-1789(+)